MGRRAGLGVLLLIVGILLLLQQMDIVYISDIVSTWWPLLLIIIGIIQLTNNKHSTNTQGLFFILFGVLFLLREAFSINIFQYAWAIILIFVGFVFIFTKGSHHTRHEKMDTEDYLHSTTIFSGAMIRNYSQSFRGGEITAIFGGAKIDLRKINLEADAYIDITAIFGGMTIIVPEGMMVDIKGAPIFGGWSNKTRINPTTDAAGPVLHIKCLPVFGGVDVKD